EFRRVLFRLLLRKVGVARLPAAAPLDLLESDLSSQDATRGEIEAVVLGGKVKDAVQIVELQDVRRVRTFSAFFPTNGGVLQIPVGSRVRVSGVFKAETDSLPDYGQVINSFQIFANAPGDIRVLARPSWWTAQHTVWAL